MSTVLLYTLIVQTVSEPEAIESYSALTREDAIQQYMGTQKEIFDDAEYRECFVIPAAKAARELENQRSCYAADDELLLHWSIQELTL